MVTFELMPPLHPIKAIIFDFDGTLAVLNIDFSAMRERVFDLMRRSGISEGAVQEKYLLEIIDEVCEMLWKKKPSSAETFYQESHDILHEVEMKAAEEGRLIPGAAGTLKRTHVMKSLKISGKEAMMVGDHMIDIQAGKRVGMKTVGVLTGRTKKEEFEKAGADYILRDASEVYKLIED